MREILFRGKLLGDGRWAVGNLVVKKDGVCIITPDDTPLGCYGQVDPDTVGQYTGLTDKDGRKIFEGDVIYSHYANVPPEKCVHIETVVFRNGRFCAMHENGTMKTWAGLPDGIKHLPGDKSVWMNCCTVIGNIHNNPELLLK